jgi:thiamine-phosphate pyrophosphorylase
MTTLAELTRRLKPRIPDPALPPLILMTDGERLADPIPVVETLPSGAAVILRHYGDPGRDALAFRLAAVCRARGLRLLIAEDAGLAIRVGASGIHLPESRMRRPGRAWRTRHRPGWLVTAAAHSRNALMRAALAGVDAVLLSPVFPTRSHPGAAPIGPLRFAAWVRECPLPVYALGGVSLQSARRLASSGAAGFAGIGGFAPAPWSRSPSS